MSEIPKNKNVPEMPKSDEEYEKARILEALDEDFQGTYELESFEGEFPHSVGAIVSVFGPVPANESWIEYQKLQGFKIFGRLSKLYEDVELEVKFASPLAQKEKNNSVFEGAQKGKDRKPSNCCVYFNTWQSISDWQDLD